MEQKLYELIGEDEQLLWFGKPEFKLLGETHKTFFAVKTLVVAFGLVAFLMYYFLGVTNGTIQFKAAVPVILVVIAAVPVAIEWLDAKKMQKTVYGITDCRMISMVDGAVHAVEYDKVKEFKFAEDADGQVSLVCGKDVIKKGPRTYRTSAVYGLTMSADNTTCERFVLYAIPEADQVKELVAKLMK